ncbi:MAG: SWIM zinc finger family protein [Aquificaceae bacterium]|nr:SWIM zinc finger family protein [Aquificaceae bacterium]
MNLYFLCTKEKEKLTELLNDKFEAKVIERGKDYAKKGHVIKKEFLNPNYLYGLVQGTELYRTEVVFYKGELYSLCTCPYGEFCKHAVALLLGDVKEKEKKPTDLKSFRKELIKNFVKTGFLEFDKEEWETLVQTNPEEELWDFLIELVKEIEKLYEDEAPGYEDYTPYVDELLIPFIQKLQEEKRAEFFWRVYKSAQYVLLVGNFADYFSLFSEKDRDVLKGLVEKESFTEEEYKNPFIMVYLEGS